MTDMDEGARRWMLKTAHTNYWRMCSWYDIDDLIQDGYMCYWRIRRRYPQATDKPHIMQLFMRTFTNYIHDLAKTRRCVDAELWFADSLGNCEQMTAPAHAPRHVGKLVDALISPDNSHRIRSKCRRKANSRETLNEKWCRLIGADPSRIDLVDELKYYLS